MAKRMMPVPRKDGTQKEVDRIQRRPMGGVRARQVEVESGQPPARVMWCTGGLSEGGSWMWPSTVLVVGVAARTRW
jgi:hypothetical protein